jgi:integrase
VPEKILSWYVRHQSNYQGFRIGTNYGIKQNLTTLNPTKGMEFMPVGKKVMHISSKEDVAKVLLAADPNTQDYLVAIINTMARVGEINRLTWNDVDFENKHVVLYTRKKKEAT